MKQIIGLPLFLSAGGVLPGWITEENSWQNVFSGKNILEECDDKFSGNWRAIEKLFEGFY